MRLRELNILLESVVSSWEDWVRREQYKNPDVRVDWPSLKDWFTHKLNSDLNSLQKINLKNAIKKSDKWHKQFYNKESQAEGKYSPEDEGVVYYHKPTGLIVYKLKPDECELEGEIMQNCAGNYSSEVASGNTKLYSIRSKHDHHVLIEVTDNKVIQVKGKQNVIPEKDKYLNATIDFIDRFGFKYGREAQTIKNLYDLKKGKTEFEGYLFLNGTQITSLPEGLKVGGDLGLGYTQITSLPEGLKVGGSLYLYDSQITSLPEVLEVSGDLDLRNTQVTSLPEGLKVGKSLYLDRTRITSLPEGLKVGGNFDLHGSQITSLPEGLKVGGYLDLINTQITSLPEVLEVGGDLVLRGTQITSLSEGLKVGGDLYIAYTPLAKKGKVSHPGVKGKIFQ